MLRTQDLEDKRVVVIPVRRQALAVWRCQIEIGMKAVTELLFQHPAEQPELRVAMMHLLQEERLAGAHLSKDPLQRNWGRHGSISRELHALCLRRHNFVGGTRELAVEILKREEVAVIFRIGAVQDQRFPFPMVQAERLFGRRREQGLEREGVEKPASHANSAVASVSR